ncbi:DNA primase [Yunchengibacter salinarum]|uniref:DNA primase n=1 Tax=Yunchengibacter salinarum TaxID=3133399 RepID=UPI0035B5CB6D
MALSSQFLDDLKGRLTLSEIIGRRVSLKRAGREYSGLCPFHSEKSPSFTVNDQKGFYHCFGCGEHGSVIDFVMKTDGLEFREAVEQLAGEAGMEMPRSDPEAARKAERRASLWDVMAAVAHWYEAQLFGQVGAEARRYLTGRGLGEDVIRRFRLGYAPADRQALRGAMQARGFTDDQLVATGMVIRPESGGAPYDRFRDRVMFPITDRRGHIIAFGGRALSADVKAKYLNSPETDLFHKGASLYNWATARAAAHDSQQVIVVEGYMDVIALAEAGIDYAVAPLGTALTEDQIGHLWRMVDEPVLSFDGDRAGTGAAMRAVDRVLPLLAPGKSLRFVFMPEGDDPDSLVRREGRGAVDRLVDSARPLAEMLWRKLTDGAALDTPERRAGLEKAVFQALSAIKDDSVRPLYQSDFRRRLRTLFQPPRAEGQGGYRTGDRWRPRRDGQRWQGAAGPGLKQTALGRGQEAVTTRLERLILLTLCRHPEILFSHEETVAGLDLHDAALDRLRAALLALVAGGETLDHERVVAHMTEHGLGSALAALQSDKSLMVDRFAAGDAPLYEALNGFEHLLARHLQLTRAQADLNAAQADLAADMTEENWARFRAAQQLCRDLEEQEAARAGL